MAKAISLKIKLVSSAGTGHYYVTTEELAHPDRQAGEEEIRPDRQEARRVQGIQDQVILGYLANFAGAPFGRPSHSGWRPGIFDRQRT